MDKITSYFHSLGLNFSLLWKSGLILLVGVLALSLIIRFIFGKRSSLQIATCSAIGILFIYAATVVLHSCGARFAFFVTPLPFVTLSGNYLYLFSFQGTFYADICSQLLSAVILALLMNLADGWLPKGKKWYTFLLLRCIGVIIAFFMHLLVVYLFTNFLPEGIVTYAPTVLLALLILMLLASLLKFILCISNPIIGGLYTFFFSTMLGKQIGRAMLTTGILTLLVLALNRIGYTAVSIASSALIAYIPFLLVLLALWYLAGHIL